MKLGPSQAAIALLVILGGASALLIVKDKQARALPAVLRTKVEEKRDKPDELLDLAKANEKSSNPLVVDQSIRARLTAAYALAEKRDYKTARQALLEIPKDAKASRVVHADFGSLSDQAKYQAAVCLVADGKEDEARAEFRNFITQNPYSPLIQAAFKRLVRLNGGDPDPNDEALIQSAIAKNEKLVQTEIASCGPRAIAELLKLTGLRPASHEKLKQLCKTDASGTTMSNLKAALSGLGIETQGREVNRPDFAKLRTPSIWLRDTHFLVLKSVSDKSATVYDPLYQRETELALPELTDAEFRAAVLETKSIKR